MKNFDKNGIKMKVSAINYYYQDNNVICKIYAFVDMPDVCYGLIGPVYTYATGVAKCSENDVYSKKRGERIARAKAESRAYRLLKNHFIRNWNYVLDVMEGLAPLKASFIEKADNCVEHNAKYVLELSEKELMPDEVADDENIF